MGWGALIVAIFIAGTGSLIAMLYSKMAARIALIERNLAVIEEERKTKEGILRDLAELSLGYSTKEQSDKLEKGVEKAQEDLRAERGRLTITQAELEAVETRLRELEEIERELEASALEVSQEIEMLRSQERNITSKNSGLQNELENTMFQLDMLLDQLAGSHEVVEQLKATKSKLVESQEKVQWYEDELGNINEGYIKLKKAYDALDIEYAQLYEKQNSL